MRIVDILLPKTKVYTYTFCFIATICIARIWFIVTLLLVSVFFFGLLFHMVAYILSPLTKSIWDFGFVVVSLTFICYYSLQQYLLLWNYTTKKYTFWVFLLYTNCRALDISYLTSMTRLEIFEMHLLCWPSWLLRKSQPDTLL